MPNWCLTGLCRLAGQVVWGRGGRCVVGGLLGFVLRGGAWTVCSDSRIVSAFGWLDCAASVWEHGAVKGVSDD